MKECFERLDLVVFLGDGVLYFIDHDLLFPDLVDVHLVGLQFDEEGQFLGGFLHVGLIQI